MKRALIIILGLAAAMLGGRLPAQPPAATPPAPAPAMTKIGVVNLIQLYEKCKRVKDLKTRMENDITPFTKKKEDLEKLVTLWQNAFNDKKNPLKPEQREQGVQIIKECRRQLEDLNFSFAKDVAKRFEDETGGVAKHIDATVKDYSARHGFHLVVAFGEPEVPLPAAVSIQRNISAMDRGFVRPVFFPGAVDITQEVINILNAQ